MTIFSLLFYLSFSFLYDDIGRGQLNMQLNKSNDDDGGGDGGEEGGGGGRGEMGRSYGAWSLCWLRGILNGCRWRR